LRGLVASHRRFHDIARDRDVILQQRRELAFDALYDHILHMSDALADGIVKQFPD
jgi:hypothetical protein